MKKYTTDLLLREEKGLAMVLALMLVTLLACFGIWLLMETHSGFRITSAYERIEETFHMAEGGCWLSVRAIDATSPALPSTTAISDITPTSESYMAANQTLGKGQITPQTHSARNFYNSTPPPGWMLNWQGGSAYYRAFYLSKGDAKIPMPSKKGDSRSVLYNLAEKIRR